MQTSSLFTLLFLILLFRKVTSYCAGLGANPGFRGPPKVEQVFIIYQYLKCSEHLLTLRLRWPVCWWAGMVWWPAATALTSSLSSLGWRGTPMITRCRTSCPPRNTASLWRTCCQTKIMSSRSDPFQKMLCLCSTLRESEQVYFNWMLTVVIK